MIFPFAVSTKIILDQKEYGITSDMYILSKINDHMEQYGMGQQRISQNEMHYIKATLLRTYKRQDFLRNLSVKVDCTDQSVLILLETNTVLPLFIALLALIMPFFLPFQNLVFHLLAFFILAVVPYGIRAIAVSMTKAEIIGALKAYKIQ